MRPQRYGSASAEDLYRLCIRSGALNMPWWDLQDNDDDPTDDDWYVVIAVGGGEFDPQRRRLDSARLWMAILACATGRIDSVHDQTAAACRRLAAAVELDQTGFNAWVANEVMQVALLGQVHWPIPEASEE